MKIHRVLRLAATGAALFSLLLFTGCGGSGTDAATAAPPAPAPAPAPAVSGTVSLLAGAFQQPGSADGPAASARFNSPNAVAQDTAGNVYVADTGNHTIRKITPDGQVSTLAGMPGQAATVDGTGSAARLSFPLGIAVGTDGIVYVGQSGAVRKITPAGIVTTLALPNPQTAAAAVALDATGNLYVLQSDILKIAPNGSVTTFLSKSAALFGTPFQSISVDSTGNLYVVQLGFPTAGQDAGYVSKFSSQGTAIPLVARSAPDFYAGSLPINYPVAVAADAAGNAYVACSGTVSNLFPTGSSTTCSSISKITPAGVLQSFAGGIPGSADGVGAAASFRLPQGVAVGPSGKIFVADTGNHVIRQIQP